MRILTSTAAAIRARRTLSPRGRQLTRHFFTFARQRTTGRRIRLGPTILVAAGVVIWLGYPRITTEAQNLAPKPRHKRQPPEHSAEDETTAWLSFTKAFENLSNAADIEWAALSDRIVDYILPVWSKLIPVYVRKLQQELSAAPGSLANEIWQEARDPFMNPEIQYSAHGRVSGDLCVEG